MTNAQTIDKYLSYVGLGLFCFSPYKGVDEHWNNPKAALHLPDMWGSFYCGWCGRLKRIHLRKNLK